MAKLNNCNGKEKKTRISKIIIKQLKKKKTIEEENVRKIVIKENDGNVDEELIVDVMDLLESIGIEIKGDINSILSVEEDTTSMDGVRLFFKDIGVYDIPTKEEEEELLKRAAEGDKSAKDELVKRNMRLVVSIANRYKHMGNTYSLLDAVQDGVIGLMQAIDTYNPDKGAKLGTYATWLIKKSIIRTSSYTSRTIRVPAYVSESKEKKILDYIEDYTAQKMKAPSYKEIGQRFNLGEDVVEALLLSRNIDSLDRVTRVNNSSADGQERTLADTIEDDNIEVATEALENVATEAMRNDIMDVLKEVLTERQAFIMLYRHGIIDENYNILDAEEKDCPSLDKIGKLYNITRERARQIYNQALDRLMDAPEVTRKLRGWWMV